MMHERTAVVAQLLRSVFPAAGELTIEFMRDSHSTEVYRVHHDGALLYLRVLPEQPASFAPEVYVHDLLCRRGLHVPEVIYFEHYNELVQCSIMLTTEIPGRPIGDGSRPATVWEIVRQAGRELAILNSVPVRGFGWVTRDQAHVAQLSAEAATYRAWLEPDLDAALRALRQAGILAARELQAVRAALEEASALFGAGPACLAHGDFDVTHIYHQDGRYTGMIDFGEIRGANQLYDLGHFQIENADLLPALLQGYAEEVALPAGYMRQILLSGLLIAMRRLGRRVDQGKGVYQPDLLAIERMLEELGQQKP